MAARPSKFSALFEASQEPEEAIASLPQPEAAAPAEVRREVVPPAESPATTSTARKTTGKKSDPRYKQVTAYIRKDLHRHVTDVLNDEVKGQEDARRKEFSELVDELLERWLNERDGTDQPDGPAGKQPRPPRTRRAGGSAS